MQCDTCAQYVSLFDVVRGDVRIDTDDDLEVYEALVFCSNDCSRAYEPTP